MNSVALKRTTLSFIASRIPEEHIEQLRLAFSKMDKNGDGQLTIDELRDGLVEIPQIKLNENELIKAINAMDANQNGLVDYSEFIAACLQSHNYLQETHLRSAFQYFDKDNSGSISKEELRICLQGDDFTLSEEQINQLLSGVDANNDGEVDYQEFIEMMRGNC